jgi:N-acetylglucosaminyldiphosphoundecaprenol N-acetyl-beta-D-mannosaminyltransferase
MTERVYGPDLMLATLDRGRARGLRHYLYGATAQTLEALVQRVHERFPGVVIVGEEAPPFRELNDIEIAQMRERIVTAAPDVVWVGLGTPRQDEFVGKHADSLAATVVGVGAAFDFLAGAKRQAPLWMQRHGLEWAFRLATEPRRLWKRYVIGLPVFAAGALRDLRRQRRRGRT